MIRSELKARGKAAFKANYWKSVLVGLLLMLISFSAVFFYPTYNVTANIFFMLIGCGWAGLHAAVTAKKNGANVVVEADGKYQVQLVWDGAQTGTITLIPAE